MITYNEQYEKDFIIKFLSQREIKNCGYETPCWLWTSNLRFKVSGYGRTCYKGEYWDVHRLSYKLFKTDFDPTYQILHKCDIRKCCNPDHLFQGTIKDNMNDMADKGRGFRQQKTHCKMGHEFTIENTYIRKRKNGRTYRSCKICIDNDNSRKCALYGTNK